MLKIAQYGLQNVLMQQDREVAEAYHALATPSAVLVHSDGLISAPLAVGLQAIAELVAQVIGERVPVLSPIAVGIDRHQSFNGVA